LPKEGFNVFSSFTLNRSVSFLLSCTNSSLPTHPTPPPPPPPPPMHGLLSFLARCCLLVVLNSSCVYLHSLWALEFHCPPHALRYHALQSPSLRSDAGRSVEPGGIFIPALPAPFPRITEGVAAARRTPPSPWRLLTTSAPHFYRFFPLVLPYHRSYGWAIM